jgi:hypothetical protein
MVQCSAIRRYAVEYYVGYATTLALFLARERGFGKN